MNFRNHSTLKTTLASLKSDEQFERLLLLCKKISDALDVSEEAQAQSEPTAILQSAAKYAIENLGFPEKSVGAVLKTLSFVGELEFINADFADFEQSLRDLRQEIIAPTSNVVPTLPPLTVREVAPNKKQLSDNIRKILVERGSLPISEIECSLKATSPIQKEDYDSFAQVTPRGFLELKEAEETPNQTLQRFDFSIPIKEVFELNLGNTDLKLYRKNLDILLKLQREARTEDDLRDAENNIVDLLEQLREIAEQQEEVMDETGADVAQAEIEKALKKTRKKLRTEKVDATVAPSPEEEEEDVFASQKILKNSARLTIATLKGNSPIYDAFDNAVGLGSEGYAFSVEGMLAGLDAAFEKSKRFFELWDSGDENSVLNRFNRMRSGHKLKDNLFGEKDLVDVSGEDITRYNDVIFAIKNVDLKVMELTKAAFADDMAKYTAAINMLEPSFVTKRFATDQNFFYNKIFAGLLYITNPTLFLFGMGFLLPKDFKGRNGKAVYEDYSKDMEQKGGLSDETTTKLLSGTIKVATWNKFRQQIDITRQGIATAVTINNFAKATQLSTSLIVMSTYLQLYKNAKKTTFTKCPMCARKIPWQKESGASELAMRGTYIPLYSPFASTGKNGRGKLSLITEDMLRVKGPYPPPSIADYGYGASATTDVAKATRAKIQRYTGNKTWDEIEALLYSGDPVAHEEGIHRKYAAFRYLGASHLKNHSGKESYNKFINIKDLMFDCPFSVRKPKKENPREIKTMIEDVLSTTYDVSADKQPILQEKLNELSEKYKDVRHKAKEKDVADVKRLVSEIESLTEEKISGGNIETIPSGCGLSFEAAGDDSWDLRTKARPSQDIQTASLNVSKLGEKQVPLARNKLSGGFKFSRRAFWCPTQIENLTNSKAKWNSLLAIPKIGIAKEGDLYHPPIKSGTRGELSQNTQGAFSYTVCGAQTSLSSFDRSTDKNSVLSILANLHRILTSTEFSKQERLAANDVINFFVEQGIDTLELSRALQVAKKMVKSQPLIASEKNLNLEKLGEKIALAEMEIPDKFEVIKDLILVCPFGHHFSINQSRKFYDTHITFPYSSCFGNTKEIKKQFLVSGTNTLSEAIRHGIIRKITERMPRMQTWAEMLDSGEAPNKENLIFEIAKPDGSVEYYAMTSSFSSDAGFAKKQIAAFSTERDYSLAVNIINSNMDVQNKHGESGQLDLTDKTSIEKYNDEQEEKEWSDHIVGYERSDMNANAKALSLQLKALLKIIITWTNQAVDTEFVKRFVADYKFDYDKIAALFVPSVMPHLTAYDEDGEEIPASAETEKYVREYVAEYMAKYFQASSFVSTASVQKTFISSLIAGMKDAVDSSKETDTEIDFSSEGDIISELSTILSETFVKVFDDVKYNRIQTFLSGQAVGSPVYKHYISQIQQNPLYNMFYNLTQKKQGREQQDARLNYGSRLFLVAYAKYLADSLADVYNEHMKFFGEDETLYIGYDIGLDLSSASKIMALTDGDIEKVSSSVTGITLNSTDITNLVKAINRSKASPREAERAAGIVRKLPTKNLTIQKVTNAIRAANLKPADLNPILQAVAEVKVSGKRDLAISNVIMAYNKLKGKMALARQASVNPKTLLAAKSIILGKVASDYSSSIIFDAFFPTVSVGFEGWRNPSQYIPDTLHDKTANTIGANHVGSVEYEKGGKTYKIPKYTNPKVGYDSSVFQVGMAGNKGVRSYGRWPLGLDNPFVFVPIPLKKGRTVSTQESQIIHAKVADYRIVIDIDGTIQDVTYLFKRGRIKQDSAFLNKLYEKMDGLIKKRDELISDADDESEADEIQEYYLEQVQTIQQQISEIQPLICHNTAFVSESGVSSNIKHFAQPTLALLSPVEALEMLKHPERFIHSISTEFDEDAVRSFVIEVYGLERVVAIYNEFHKQYYRRGLRAEMMDEPFRPVTVDTLFDNDPGSVLGLLEALQKYYGNHTGRYYNVVPMDSAGRGSYVNFISRSAPEKMSMTNVQLPEETEPTIEEMARAAGVRNQEISGVYFGGEGGSQEKAPMTKVLDDAHKAMKEYVDACVYEKIEIDKRASLRAKNLNELILQIL